MQPSTTAIIFATQYTNHIFLQIHMFRFFMDLCVHWNACHEYYYFASLGIFMHQGYRMQRLTKSLHIFWMDKWLLEDFVLKCNQWKYWMSFIACGCCFSRSYTVYSWLGIKAIGHLGISNNAMISLSDHQTIAYYSSIPNAQSNSYWTWAVHVSSVCIRSWLFTCNKLKCQNIIFLKLFRNFQAEK